MGENVSTGGTKDFHYPKGHEPKLKEDEKKEIGHAYDKYYVRRAREKRNKTIMIVIIAVIIIAIILGFTLF